MTDMPPRQVMEELEWVDSTGSTGWTDVDEAAALAGKIGCRAAGYIVHETGDTVVLALAIGGMPQYLTPMAIPKAAIISRHRLRRE